MTHFERGWYTAIALWRSGQTLESIQRETEEQGASIPNELAGGVLACVEAMRGWKDSARRVADRFGVSPSRIEELLTLLSKETGL